MDKLYTIDAYAARLLMMALFMPEKLQVIVIIAACAWFAFRTVSTRNYPSAAYYLWALAIGAGYLLYVCSFPLTPHEYRHELSSLCERKMSFLLMPVIFSFISPTAQKSMSDALIYFMYACFISCGLANVDYLYHYFFVNGGLHHFSHVDYRNIFEFFTGLHPTYMSMYLCFSICILLFSTEFDGTPRGLKVKYGVLYLLLIFLLSLLAKATLIALIIIFIHYAWLNRKVLYRYKLLIGGMLTGIIIACVSIPFARQRIGEVFQFIGIGKPGDSTENSFYDRKMIFNTDLDMVRHYWTTGVGPGRMLRMLHERYFFHSITRQSPTGYFDPHNEYFFQLISFGIFGLAVFAGILLLHFMKAIRVKDYLYMYLLIILSVTFFTESVLSRQQGVLFYAVFTSFFFFRAHIKSRQRPATP